jgi:hypothetical protein
MTPANGSSRRVFAALAVSLTALLCLTAPALAAAPEEPETTAPNEVKATTATFHGVLNPLAPEPVLPGTYEFLYNEGGTCEGGGKVPASPAIDLGAVHEEVSETVSGLKASTEYAVCLLARNGTAGEETLGPAMTFTTATPPEEPETTSFTGVTATTATLEGVLNPKASLKAGWYFSYSTESTCTGAGALKSSPEPEPEEEVTAKGETKEVTELQPNTTYKFCLDATNSSGEAVPGNEKSFTTLGLPPQVFFEFETNVNSTGATLNVLLNPNNEKTTYIFEYATNEALTGATTVTGAPPLEGLIPQFGSAPTGVLLPGTTYFYRVLAENEQTETEGKPVVLPVQSFTTVPTPFTDAVDGVTTDFAVFHGHLTPLNEKVATQYHFSYNLGGGVCTGEHSTSSVQAGTAPPAEVTATAGVGSLQPHAKYTVCFVSSNAFGSAEGPPEHFETKAAPPRILRVGSSEPSTTGVKLEAVINPNNQETKYAFDYSTSEAALLKGEGTKGATGTLLPEFKELSVNDALSVLTPDTTYFFRVIAENPKAEKTEALGRASTQGPPLVTTEAPQNVTSLSAGLSGTVYPGGLPTTYSFLYVPASEYEPLAAKPYAKGRISPTFNVGPDSTVHPVSYLAELKPGETYDYTLVATNELATVTGANQTFATPALSPPAGESEAVNPSPGPSPFAAGTLPPVIPFQSIAQIEAKEPKGNTGPPPKKLTKHQRLAKALKACNKKPRKKRAACRRAAKRRFR